MIKIFRNNHIITLFTAFVLTLTTAGCMSVTVQTPKQADTPVGTTEAEEETDGSQAVETDSNLIPGASFTDSNSAWGIYTESGGIASFDVSGGKCRVHIADPGRVAHAVQLYCGGFEVRKGGEYHFSARISSDVPRNFEWRIQVNGGDYHPYCRLENVSIGPEEEEITCDFTMTEPSDPAPRMCFNFGDEGKSQGLGEHNIMIKDISLELKNEKDTEAIDLPGEIMNVNINQIGYHPDADKRAVVRLEDDILPEFQVIDTAKGSTVYKGTLTAGIDKGSSGDKVGYADFSDLKTPGKYRISVDGIGDSYEFVIASDVFDSAFVDTLRMLTLQRCGCELSEELAGDFAHKACHTEEARVYGGNRFVEVSGGWHDAGDYGRYTVPAAKTIADLLLAYENYPAAFDRNFNIPESGNGVPDVLNEARYELDWLLKMQGSDGGVYHKVTGLNFDGFVMSDECTEELYLLPESKTATADFAAVMYMASRVYRPFDAGFADRCISAADRAMDAYIAHIDDMNFTNPPDVFTGEYKDKKSVDEFLWALCEGYKTTGDVRFEKKLELIDTSKITVDGFGWDDVSGYAYYAHLTSDRPMKMPFDVKTRFFELCRELKDTALYGESYGCTITEDYPWGSNMYIANNGIALLMAYSMTGDEDYRLAAQRQLDYLFGTNCTSYCFLTGYGTQSPEHPHHRPSQALGKCMKGMLVGGPDSALEDPYAKAVLKGLPKARCYVDNEQTYSCNEVTIYWNSPLVYLLAGLK